MGSSAANADCKVHFNAPRCAPEFTVEAVDLESAKNEIYGRLDEQDLNYVQRKICNFLVSLVSCQ